MRTGNRQQARGNSKRTKLFRRVLCAVVFALSASAEAQQTQKIPRIGFLQRRAAPSPANPDPLGDAFRRGLRDLGYIDGKTIIIEQRYAEGSVDRIPPLVAELVQLNVDVLVFGTSPAIRAAKQATKTIPIVMIMQGDPVASGLVESLARPGGNLTGLTRLTQDLNGKRMELLKETVPRISRVGILVDASSPETAAVSIKDYEATGRALKIAIQPVEIRGPKPDFEGAFQAATKGRIDALITIRDALTASHLNRIAEVAIKHRLPSMHADRPYVEAGGLMSYATNDADQFKRAAVYVDKILKGAKPADLPIEQPTKFEFVINLKTAKQIGLTIPPNVLARADRVIR
jgi:putative ABC transport system substrate-binding protein